MRALVQELRLDFDSPHVLLKSGSGIKALKALGVIAWANGPGCRCTYNLER